MAEVLIPFRSDDPARLAALAWVEARLAALDVEVSRGPEFDGPWCKARSVRFTGHDVVVVHDADVWCDALPEAIDAVTEGAPWAVPHGPVRRLTVSATAAVLSGQGFGPRLTLAERPYMGKIGGGVVVLRRDVYESCPLDPRFVGWGQEDESWGLALTTLHGAPWRSQEPLWHLWHAPQPRRTRRTGSEASRALWRRYKAATRNPAAMRSLLDEIRSEVAA